MTLKNNATCPKCGKGYRMGYNGITDGCDKCLDIKRDKQGHFWLPRERIHIYEEVGTGKFFKVKRSDALGK